MGNKRFSMTTYVLVGISLVALYFVGKTVTPPPLAPTPEVTQASVKTPVAPSPAKTKAEDLKNTAENQAKAKQYAQQMAKAKAHPVDPNAFNPTSIDTSANYWHDKKVNEGAQGEKIMAARVKEATAKMPKPLTTPILQKASKTDQQH